MSNAVTNLEPASNAGSRTSTSRKLLQAAALAAVLVPLGSVAVETATINCVSQAGGSGSPCNGVGTYSGGGSFQSNTWKFFTDFTFTQLIYEFDIGATPLTDYSLEVEDFVTTQSFLVSSGALALFPTAVCIPTHSPGQCGLFDVFQNGVATSSTGYDIAITWFNNADPLSQPPDDGGNTILQAKDGGTGFGTVFTNPLTNIDYDPAPTPTDPAIGGRADGFSRFGAFRTVAVPEPGSLFFAGLGVAGLIVRVRRRKRTS